MESDFIESIELIVNSIENSLNILQQVTNTMTICSYRVLYLVFWQLFEYEQQYYRLSVTGKDHLFATHPFTIASKFHVP